MLRLQMGVWGASPRASLGSFMKATRAAASWSGSRIFTVLGRRFSRKALKLTWSWSPDLVTGIRLPAISMYCGLPSKTCRRKAQRQEVMLLSCSGSNMGHTYLYVLQPFFQNPSKESAATGGHVTVLQWVKHGTHVSLCRAAFFPKPVKGKRSNRGSCYCPMWVKLGTCVSMQ